jgi:multidrug resistance efflux pump
VAPGRVEPAHEERVVRPQRAGVIVAVLVEENDPVEIGQVLAELDRGDLLAQRRAAHAGVKLARARRARIAHGARLEERREASAQLAQSRSHLTYREREFARHEKLNAEGTVPPSELDRSRLELDVALARNAEAVARTKLVLQSARRDDLRIADAEIDVEEAKVAIVDAELNKTSIVSPISGTVLRRFGKVGEVVGVEPPPALFVLGRTSTLQVRAEIDELDVGRIHVSDKARVVADAFPNATFSGTVTRVGGAIGVKEIVTDLPGERQDRKVLSSIVTLDPAARLPIGLRVEVFID